MTLAVYLTSWLKALPKALVRRFRRATSITFPATRSRPAMAVSFLACMLAFHVGAYAQQPTFAYVVNHQANSLSIFSVNEATGVLTLIGSAAVGFGPQAISVTPDHRFMYVSNEPGNTISAFSINNANGQLTPVPGPPASDEAPHFMAIAPSGKFLYSSNLDTHTVSVFGIDSGTGSLTAVATVPTSGSAPLGIGITPDGRFAYVANRDSNRLAIFKADPSTGSLEFLGLVDTQAGPTQVIVDSGGQFVYAVNGSASSVSGYAIDATTGLLTPIPGSPFQGMTGPIGIVIDSAIHVAYVSASDGIHRLKIDPTTGALSSLGAPTPSTAQPYFPAIDPSGKYAYWPNYSTSVTSGISGFQIDPATGDLTPVPGSPFPDIDAEVVSIALIGGGACSGSASVLPNSGGNTGTVTVTLICSGAQPGALVKLTGIGSDIAGTNTSITDGVVTTTFDLTGAAPGVRNVVVANPSETPLTLEPVFTVEQGGAPNLSVDIIGRDKTRPGWMATYYLAVTNTGSIDSGPHVVSLSVPSLLSFTQKIGTSLFPAGVTSADPFGEATAAQGLSMVHSGAASSGPGNQNLRFATSNLPPGQTQLAPVQITVPFDVAVSDFTMTPSGDFDNYPSNFNDYLGEHAVPFPWLGGMVTTCEPQFQALSDSYDNASRAYSDLGKAQSDVSADYGVIVGSASKVIAQTIFIEELGFTKVGSVVLDGFVSLANDCIAKNVDDPAHQACLPTVDGVIDEIKNGAAGLVAGQFGKEFASLVTVAQAAENALTPQHIDQLNSDIAIRNAALQTFTSLFGTYPKALAAFNTCSGNIPPQPPPNSSKSLTVELVASLDPNEKIGSRGVGNAGYLIGTVPLTYEISFTNDPSATAPAQTVIVTDPLPRAVLDLGTLSFGPIVFQNHFLNPPPGTNYSTVVDLRPTTDLLVGVDAGINLSTGVITWKFTSLDPATGQPTTDPTAGFLPPGGTGSLLFTLRPRQDLVTNTQIENLASVVFDTNAPISTPSWVNTIDRTPPVSHAVPLPPTESDISFPVGWAGTDVGAGVQDFTIFASDNGGPFTLWLQNVAATSATFTGQLGHTYSFYSIARDLVGNMEPAKTSAEATTRVEIDTTPPVITITTPANGATYSTNQLVKAAYACTDVGSGIATCTGTVPNGGNIDTFPSGPSTAKTFVVNATDVAGNPASQSVSYTVSCHYVGLGISPSTVARGGKITVTGTVMSCTSSSQTVSVKFTLTGPLGPKSCANCSTVMFTSPPFTIAAGTKKTISFPFVIPKSACAGQFTITTTTLVGGTAVDSSSATLTVQ